MKIIKIILILFLTFLFGSNVLAVSLNTSTNVDILYVGVYHKNVWSGWQKEVDVYKGDKVWFHIHAYANGGDIKNLSSKLENINHKNFNTGRTAVTAFVDADNAQKIIGKVYLNFKNPSQLNYMSYKWAIKLKGENPEENEHVKKLPYGQSGPDAMRSEGVLLGDLTKDYRSNLLLAFSTQEVLPPEDGICSNQKNRCAKGSFYDIKDDAKNYKWICKGVRGGRDGLCFLEKKPIDGVCSTAVNKCRAGYFKDIPNDSKYYLWTCVGQNGGSTTECKVEKKPINAICSKYTNKCVKGKFSDIKDTKIEILWKCSGYYGGKDIVCKKKKWCLCSDLEKNNSVQYNIKTNNNSLTCSNADVDFLLNENTKLKREVNDLLDKNDELRKMVGKDVEIKKEDSGLGIFWWFLWILSLILVFLIAKRI